MTNKQHINLRRMLHPYEPGVIFQRRRHTCIWDKILWAIFVCLAELTGLNSFPCWQTSIQGLKFKWVLNVCYWETFTVCRPWQVRWKKGKLHFSYFTYSLSLAQNETSTNSTKLKLPRFPGTISKVLWLQMQLCYKHKVIFQVAYMTK